MPYVQVLEDPVPIAGNAVIARDFVYVDWSQVDTNLQGAFAFLSSIRLERIQLWATSQVPLKNSNISAQPALHGLAGYGPIDGQITGVQALDANGNAVTNWQTDAHSVAFSIVAQTNVTIPKAAISGAVLAANPLIGAIVTAFLATLPSDLPINIGHTSTSVPITRDGTGRITEIGTSSRPA